MRGTHAVGRAVVVLVVAAAGTLASWFLFVEYPVSLTDLLGILVALGTVAAAVQVGSRLAGSVFPGYNVAEVAVEGPIQRETGGMGRGLAPGSPGADAVVEQIERADADRNAEALLVKLNTPGGQVVPSDDIRQAAADFEGPTVAYTNDVCASGGMWIASGCDELWARDASLVGSIGVIFASFRINELLEDYGVSYERIVSGDYKDATQPFKELEEHEREYLQGISDAWYDTFVERVAEGTAMDEAEIRETEAKIYLGEEAVDIGMVDALGDREAVETSLEDRLGEPVDVREFTPRLGLTERLRSGAQGLAYAFGAGIAGTVVDGDGSSLRLR